MRVPRILVDLPLATQDRVILPLGPSRHLIQVLRRHAGDPLILFNGDGRDFGCRILVAAKDAVQVQVEERTDLEPPPTLEIHLGIGVSRGERMDEVVQKAVELGVSRISPLFTKRSMVRLDGVRLQKRRKHWEGVLVAACEQCGRRRLAELATADSLARWLERRHPYSILLDHRSAAGLPELTVHSGALTLLVGPEGGLTPQERNLAKQAGFIPVRLGPRILRTETAPLAALAAIQALWGDFRK
jgi:16S rRNA (uracil1498-N3)-methyltransferase